MNDNINITLPDGAVKQYPKGATALDIAKDPAIIELLESANK